MGERGNFQNSGDKTMNENPAIKNTNGDKNKNLEILFEKARQRALQTPVMDANKNFDRRQFVDFVQVSNQFAIATGVLVIFDVNDNFGKFYPHWNIESALFNNKSKRVVSRALWSSQQVAGISARNLLALGNCGIEAEREIKYSIQQIGLISPFSEADILLLHPAYQQMIEKIERGNL